MTSTRLETPPELQVLGACAHDCPDTCARVTTVVDCRAVAVTHRCWSRGDVL